MNIIDEYQKELLVFYSPHFKNDKDLNAFVDLAFNYDDKYSQVRFMIQQVERFVSLANDIDKIRPARDPLRVIFLKTCLEALCDIAGYTQENKKEFYIEFEKCFSNEGSQYILSNFKYIGIDIPDGLSLEQKIPYYNYENLEFTMSCFLKLLHAIRNMVVHEGDYWTTQLFSHDSESIWITSIKTNDRIFDTKKEIINYHFQTRLNYSKFIFYFVQACIKFIDKRRMELYEQ